MTDVTPRLRTASSPNGGFDSLSDSVAAFFADEQSLMADPVPLYEQLRKQGAYRHGGKVIFSRYADVREMSHSPHTWQPYGRGATFREAIEQLAPEPARQLQEVFDFFDRRLAGANGERHEVLRRLAQRAFSPKTIAAMEERIRAVADMLLDPLGNEVELISEFAYHLPLIVVSEMLQVPIEDREKIRAWTNDVGALIGGGDWVSVDKVSRAYQSLFEMRAYLSAVFNARRDETPEGLLGALLSAQDEGLPEFAEDDLLAMVSQFVLAGHETTTNLIAGAVKLLLSDHRDQWDLLTEDLSRIPAVIEEVLRYDPPARCVERVAASDFEFGGVEINQFDSLWLMLGAANRDPGYFPDPDRFDITRKRTSNVAFGFGAHLCIGAGLARLEATVALRTLAERFPRMRLATTELRWQPNHMLRQYERMPVVLEPA